MKLIHNIIRILRKISIFILLIIFASCGLIKRGRLGSGNPNFHLPKGDSVGVETHNVDTSTSFGDVENHHLVQIESADMMMGDSYDFSRKPPGLKIIEVKNTKVIKQSSELAEGRIVYKIPDVMKVRTTYKVLVRISKSKNVVSIYDSLQGTVMESKIPVTETMEVKLLDISPADNKAFEIVDGNSGVQMVEEGETYTEWSWNVTPVRVGNSRLKIIVSVIRNGNKKDIVYEDSVEVQKDIWVQIGFFFKKYWQVFMTAIAIPFIVFLYKRRKENKKEKDGDK